MDAKRFLADFRHIAAAPNGVEQLRQLAMGLALAGNLTENKSLPEDFAVYIEAARQKYFDELGRKVKLLLFGEPLIKEFRIPPGWRWIRVGEICELQTGGTPSTQHPEYFGGDIRWLVSGDINQGEIYDCKGRITEEGLKNSNCSILPANSVLIALAGQGKTRATVAILRVAAACNQSLVALISFSQDILNPEYLLLSLKYRYYEIRDITGQKQRRGLNMSLVSQLSIPLAPIDEQKRIVAKVNELMALCDKLEAQQQEREALCKLTCTAVFQTLARAKTPAELQIAWRRVEMHTSLLLDIPESVRIYRGMILDLAMSGWLQVPEDRATSTGSMLLAEIADRRAVWAKTAKGQELKEAVAMRKKVRTQQIIAPDLNLPAHWTWGSFLQISQAVVDCHNKTAPYVSDGIHLIRTTDIRNGCMDLEHTRKVSQDTYAYWARRLPPQMGDVIFTREAPMGEAAIVPEGEKVCLGQRTILVRLFPELFNNRFLLYAIYSPVFQQRMMKAAIGMTVKHLRVGSVEGLMIPVPPKAEQDWIVKVIDALLAHCDRLETQLSHMRDTAANLARASIEAITGIRIEDKEKMRVPKTELVSNLRIGVSPPNKEQAPLAAILISNHDELSANSLWNISGLKIDAFYQQLKTEMAKGWIVQPEVAYMREVGAD